MKLVETRFYYIAMLLTDYILLGILWVVVSLPLVTFIPASLATLFVIHQWNMGNKSGILKLFFLGFKQHFRLKMLFSLSILFIYFSTTINLKLIKMTGEYTTLLISLFAINILIAVFFCFRLSQYFIKERIFSYRWILNSSIEVFTCFVSNFLFILISYLFYVLVAIFPPFIFIFAGGYWRIVYSLLNKKF